MTPTASERALKLLREVPNPDECSYNSVLNAMTMTKQTGTEKMVTSAEALFEEMKELRDKKLAKRWLPQRATAWRSDIHPL